VKHISYGGLVIDCETTEDTDGLIDFVNTKTGNDFIAHKPKLRNPKIIVFGINSDVSEEELIQELIDNNRQIKEFFDSNQSEDINENIKIRFKLRKNSRNSSQNQSQNVFSTDNYVLDVSPRIHRLIKSTGRLKLGLSSLRVDDYYSVTRCHRCNGFGHIQTQCKNNQMCGHCSGDHNSEVCTTPKESQKCVSCLRENQKNRSNRKLATNHSSFDVNCQCYQRVVETIKSKTNYEF
jgi:hypothetical protein